MTKCGEAQQIVPCSPKQTKNFTKKKQRNNRRYP